MNVEGEKKGRGVPTMDSYKIVTYCQIVTKAVRQESKDHLGRSFVTANTKDTSTNHNSPVGSDNIYTDN